MWDTLRNLAPNVEIIRHLKKIGATPNSWFWSSPQFPCKCILKDGEELDFCVVLALNAPPVDDYFQRPKQIGGKLFERIKRIVFMDDVMSVGESEYALSKRLRTDYYKIATEPIERIRGWSLLVEASNACHYPKLVSLRARRTPSTSELNFSIPRHSVSHPGSPSPFRFR